MFLSLLNKIKGWAIITGVTLLALLAIVRKFYNKGVEDTEEKAEEAVREDVKDYEEVKDRVSRMSDDELDSKLREWSRKR